MKTIATLIVEATRQLRGSGIESARLDAELLLAHSLQKPRTWIIAHDDELVDEDHFQHLLARRLRHEPLAYIIEHKEFYGRRFSVTPDVLVPRPESEMFFTLLARFSPERDDTIIDIGCGSGILAITAALEYPEIQVLASDISEAALATARQNAAQLGTRVKFYNSDLLQAIPIPQARRVFILANLPYVDPAWSYLSPELAYEPNQALYSSDHGLAHSFRLLHEIQQNALNNVVVLFETDRRQQSKLTQSAIRLGFRYNAQVGLITAYTLQASP